MTTNKNTLALTIETNNETLDLEWSAIVFAGEGLFIFDKPLTLSTKRRISRLSYDYPTRMLSVTARSMRMYIWRAPQ